MSEEKKEQPGAEMTDEEFERLLLRAHAESALPPGGFDPLAHIKEQTADLAQFVEPFPSGEEQQRKYYMDSFGLLVKDIPEKVPNDERAHLYHVREFLNKEVMWACERDGTYFRLPGQKESQFVVAMTRPGHPDAPKKTFIATKEQMGLQKVITRDAKFLEDGRPVKVSDVLILSPEAISREWAAIIITGGLTMLEILPLVRDIDKHGREDQIENLVTALIIWGEVAAASHLSCGRLGPAMQSVINRYNLHNPREIMKLARAGQASGEISETLDAAIGATAPLSDLEKRVRRQKYASFLIFAQKFPQLDTFSAILVIKEKLSRLLSDHQ